MRRFVPDFERRFPAIGIQHLVAMTVQGVADVRSHLRFVLDHQNAFLARAGPRRRRCRSWVPHLLGGRGKPDAEGAARTGLALHLDPPFMLFDYSIDGGESQAGAAADRFGGEKRLKYAPLRFRIHAAAGVLGADDDKAPGPRLRVTGRGTLQVLTFNTDAQRSAAGHGVAGIDGQVEQHLLYVGPVAHDARDVFGDINLDLNGLPHQRGQHFFHILDIAGHIQAGPPQDLFAAEGQQLGA